MWKAQLCSARFLRGLERCLTLKSVAECYRALLPCRARTKTVTTRTQPPKLPKSSRDMSLERKFEAAATKFSSRQRTILGTSCTTTGIRRPSMQVDLQPNCSNWEGSYHGRDVTFQAGPISGDAHSTLTVTYGARAAGVLESRAPRSTIRYPWNRFLREALKPF